MDSVVKRTGELLKLWTITTLETWQILQQRGVLRTEPTLIEQDWASAYTWMVAMMDERMCRPSPACQFPLWAWYQWHGKQRKPDLRFGAHLNKGVRGVRIEFEIDDNNVLRSDYNMWHAALGYWYLPSSEADDIAFELELKSHDLSYIEQKPLPHLIYHQRIEESWRRIFDLEWFDPYCTSAPDQKAIQAVFWELHLNQIRKVDYFTAR